MKERSITFLLLAMLMATVLAVELATDEAEAARQYDVKLTYTEEAAVKLARGLNPISFNYTVEQVGDANMMQTVIELQNEPGGWQHTLTAVSLMTGDTDFSTGSLLVDIQRQDVLMLTVTITPLVNELNRTYWLTLDAYPRRVPSDNESHDVGIVIPQLAAFEIVVWNPPPGGVFEALPPSTITVRFALFNRGNGVDRFLVKVECSRETAGWNVAIRGGVDEFGYTDDLPPDPSRKSPYFIFVEVALPADERAGVTAQLLVSVSSMFDPERQMPPAFASLMSLQYFAFWVFIVGDDKRTGFPGEQVEFKLQINNLGNGWDIFSIKPVWDEALSPGFIASANPRTLVIDACSNDTAQFIVKAPEGAFKRTYFFNAEIASSGIELSPVTRSFAVQVDQSFAVELSSPHPRLETLPGGVLDFGVTVRNAGNGLDSVELDLTGIPPGWLHYITPPEATLLQGQETVVGVRIIVPTRFEEAPIGSYSLTLRAESSRSDARADLTLQVVITKFNLVEWFYNDERETWPDRPVARTDVIRPRRTLNPYERDSMDVTLEVKNLGSGNDSVSIEGRSPDPRIAVQVTPSRTLLLRDQTRYVKATITVPRDLPPGVYYVHVSACSEDHEQPARVFPVDLEVYNQDAEVPSIPVFVDGSEGTGSDVVRQEVLTRLGSNLRFKLPIENEGTRPIPSLLVRVYDNYQANGERVKWNFLNLTTPPIGVGDTYTLGEGGAHVDEGLVTWWANRTGDHVLEFRVYYDHQSSIDNDLSTVNVTVAATNEGGDPPGESLAFLGGVIAVAIAVLVVAGYVAVLRWGPRVDPDLYGSIYSVDFEDVTDGGPSEDVPEPTPEELALYGDDRSLEELDG